MRSSLSESVHEGYVNCPRKHDKLGGIVVWQIGWERKNNKYNSGHYVLPAMARAANTLTQILVLEFETVMASICVLMILNKQKFTI